MHAIQSESFEIISRVDVPPGVSHVNPWRVGEGILYLRQRKQALSTALARLRACRLGTYTSLGTREALT